MAVFTLNTSSYCAQRGFKQSELACFIPSWVSERGVRGHANISWQNTPRGTIHWTDARGGERKRVPGQRAPSRGSSTLSILFSSSSCWRSTMSRTFPLGSPARSASRPKWRDTSTGTGSCVCRRLGRRCRRYQKAKVSCGQINGKRPVRPSVEESHRNDSQKKKSLALCLQPPDKKLFLPANYWS